MATNTDYATQLTLIYNKLSDIQQGLGKLALMSYVNTIQEDLQGKMSDITLRLENLTTEVNQIQLTMSDLLTELRSK